MATDIHENHMRRCWDCGTTNEHTSRIVPGVLCPKCGSQDTRAVRDKASALTGTYLNASGPLAINRDLLGQMVREAWVRWAKTQPNPKPSWLEPYECLSEADQEADRQIGEVICRATMLAIAAKNGSPVNDYAIRQLTHLNEIRSRLVSAIWQCKNDGLKNDLEQILGERA